ncbi:MAG: hypothetical protein WD598_07945 [Acidimicrobiia bacterium]
MNETIALLGVVIAIAAAARSTWSPCGQSMLSQITPIAEAGRRQRFGRTACWFIGGAVVGGLTLGGLVAGFAAVVAATDLGQSTALGIVAACAFAGAAVDARILGFGPPFFRRQVNEYWLSTYRAWLYGSGFGWQIGVGFATYIMTAAVPLIIVLAALSASPWAALGIGAVFGLARGLAVLLGAPVRTLPALHSFHRRFDAAGEPVRQVVIAVQLAVAIGTVWAVAPAAVATVVTVGAVAIFAWARYRTSGADAPMVERADVDTTQRQAVA